MATRNAVVALAIAGVLSAVAARAATPVQLQAEYETLARNQTPGFAGFSAARGAAFFRTTHGNEWSCANCAACHPKAAVGNFDERAVAIPR